ncbi:MAG: hypothetical protein ABL901_14005 [Hyphomicrobiaceae bacterium]
MAMRLWATLLAVSAMQLLQVHSAQATSDSWVRLDYPLTDLQEEGHNCEAQTVVLDPVSTGPHATARLIAAALSSPILVPNPIGQPGVTADANAITDGAKASVTSTFLVDDDGTAVARGKLTLDASALAAANGTSPDGRQDALRRMKQITAFSLRNFLKRHEKAAISVSIDGLPSQDGLPGLKLPATLQSPVSAGSPWLADLIRELKPNAKCPL